MKRKLYCIFLILVFFSCEDSESLSEDPVESYQVLNSQTTSNTDNNLPMTLPDNFIWGVNGHPITQEAYLNTGTTANAIMQIDLINEHLFSFYRMDIVTDSLGLIRENSWRDEFAELVDNLPNNIKLLPVLLFSSFDFQLTEEELYQKAKDQVEGFMGNYGNYFDYVAIGNEEDNKAIYGPQYVGDKIDHYDLNKLTKIAAYLKGMSESIKGINNSIQVIINNGGAGHSAYHDFLDNYLYNGSVIEYDIAGLHWYNENQDIDILAQEYTKDVWITESNAETGSYNNTENEQAEIVNAMIHKLDNQTKIKAFFLYELYNEPAFENKPLETQYGIIKWETKYSSFSYKPLSEVLKFIIEESTFGFEDYVRLFYERVNLFEPDVNSLNYWTNLLKSNGNKVDFLDNILPEKSYELFIREQYQNLLDRPGDLGGVTYWVDKMKSGFTRESVILEFCNGMEFWNKSGQNNIGFIERLYLKLFGRAVDNTGLTYWVNELNCGISRWSVVDQIMNENEYFNVFVSSQYQALYQREGDTDGIDYWVNRMQNGLNQQNLIIEFLLNEEFWKKSIIKGYETKNTFPFSHN